MFDTDCIRGRKKKKENKRNDVSNDHQTATAAKYAYTPIWNGSFQQNPFAARRREGPPKGAYKVMFLYRGTGIQILDVDGDDASGC